MMNTPANQNAPGEEIARGTAVHDVNKVQVGTVIFSALRDGFFVVEKGWLFTQQLYLPATAILAYDAEGITLRLTKGELKSDQWKQPPASSMDDTATPVYPHSPLPESKPDEEADTAGLPPAIPGKEPPPQSRPAVEAGPAGLPPDNVRPLPGEAVPLIPPDDDSPATNR